MPRQPVRLAFLTAVALTCAAAGGCRQADTRAAGDSTVAAATILFFGDSITRGQGVDTAEAFPALLERRLTTAGFDYRCINAGVSGDTSEQALDRIDRYLEGPPRLVVVELGANDVRRGINRLDTYENLVEIVERFTRAGSRVILAATLFEGLHPAYDRSMRRMYEKVANDTGALLVPDLMIGVSGLVELNLPDRIHPNPRGHRRLAETAWPYLEKALYVIAAERRR